MQLLPFTTPFLDPVTLFTNPVTPFLDPVTPFLGPVTPSFVPTAPSLDPATPSKALLLLTPFFMLVHGDGHPLCARHAGFCYSIFCPCCSAVTYVFIQPLLCSLSPYFVLLRPGVAGLATATRISAFSPSRMLIHCPPRCLLTMFPTVSSHMSTTCGCSNLHHLCPASACIPFPLSPFTLLHAVTGGAQFKKMRAARLACPSFCISADKSRAPFATYAVVCLAPWASASL